MTEENKTLDMEIVSGSALEMLQRAEIDVQITTAKRFPRSIDKFRKQAITYATADEETAESCIYHRPVGKDGGVMKYADGMSVRLAEIVSACYGNLRVGAMLVEIGERKVVARGVAHDLEQNVFSASEVVESCVDKYNKPYSERMRAVVAKAALAKARRDAIFQVVPRALCRPVETAVRGLLNGKSDGQTMTKRRERALAWCRSMRVPFPLVFAALGVRGEGDIGIDELEKLNGIKTAIQEGETTIDEAFPAPSTEPEVRSEKPGDEKALAEAGLAPEKKEEPKDKPTPQAELAAIVEGAGHDFRTFIAWALESGNIKDADSIPSWDEVPTADATRIARSRVGLLKQLGMMKGGK